MNIREPKQLQEDKILVKKIKIQVPSELAEGEKHTSAWMGGRQNNNDYFLGKGTIETKSKQVDVNAIYSIFKSLEAIFYMDERKAVFSSDNLYSHIAELYNDMAEYDYPRMNKHLHDWKQLCDGLTYSVGVKRIKHWDKKGNHPVLENLNPCSCIFDPEELLDGTNRRYFGYKAETLITDLQKGEKKGRYFGITAGLSSSDFNRKKVEVVYFYTIIDDVPYLTTWVGKSNLIGIAEFSSELAGNFGISKFIPFPTPKGGGTDLIELGVKYQNLLKQTINLLLKQATLDAYGEDKLVDINVGVDIDELTRPSIEPKHIPVEDLKGKNLSDVVHTLPRGQAQTKAENSMGMLRGLLQESTGVTDGVQGLVPEKNMTKGENQNIQQNANLRFSTISRFLLLSEGNFRKAYVIFNRVHFKGSKNIVLKRKHKNYYSIVTRKDITSKEFINFTVEIESKIEKQKSNNKKFTTHLQLIPFSQQYFSKYTTILSQRELWKLSGESEEDVYNRFPLTPDERIARLQLVKLNKNEKVDEPRPTEDHEVFRMIFSSGVPTVENLKALMVREMLLSVVEKPVEENENARNMQNITQAQIGNQRAQESAGQITSNQDVNAI